MERYEAYKDSGVEWIGEIPAGWEVRRIKEFCVLCTGHTPPTSVTEYFDGDVNWYTPGDISDNRLEASRRKVSQLAIDDRQVPIYPAGSVLLVAIGDTGRVGLSLLECSSNQQITALIPRKCYSNWLFYAMQAERARLNNLALSTMIPILNNEYVSNYKLALPSLEEQHVIADYLDEKTAEIDGLIADCEREVELLQEYRKAVVSEAVTKGLDPDAPMKDSGIEWIGKMPKEWECVKIKALFRIEKRIVGYEGPTVLSITQRGIVPKDLKSGEGQLAMDYSNYQWVYPGDFAMNHMDLLTGWVDCSQVEGVTSPDYRVFVPLSENIHRSYFKYLFQHCYSGKVFYGLGQGVSGLGRWRLPTKRFNNFIVPYPSIAEQKKIVEALDTKTAEIDSLIEAKQSMVDKLREYRRSLISEAVTGKFKVPGV
ncbi:MAG: restriction endonuclease subunit S [Atopobiaceae bacterium]|nr:restriction endonuclease subunit S [Atopobiaceae bacterium]